ncbi:SDR family oxidoreductase [Lacisediminimonas profundi]|uniref:SDR family oxidoreductase n=1 Tax=Lacisediminimonas profundi TaxID=2603856 RepID=UPI00124B44C3|nr:SDR family oxidoreductase [Lacisediminimonas profundi]
MSTFYEETRATMESSPRAWLVTGAAGFIGSHLVEALLALNQRVVGLDNFSTGHASNLAEIQAQLGASRWKNFRLIEGDIRDPAVCREACSGAEFVLHEAALGSVPRSIQDPLTTNAVNISGFLNMLVAARGAGVLRFIYAASSSTYGDHPDLPKIEDRVGNPLSPYAVTKLVNELYADVFARTHGFESMGLRYFNVFGPRQDPDGPYAAVIPKWITAMIRGEPVFIHGDGETSRDFSFVQNVVQANLLAAMNDDPDAINQVYNIALGNRTTLNELFAAIRRTLAERGVRCTQEPVYLAFRPGDVRHSQASIAKASTLLGYVPSHSTEAGLGTAIDWALGQELARPKQ